LVAVAVWLPAAQAKEDNGRGSTDGLLAKLSQDAAIGYLRAHPDQAPPEFAERLQAAEQLASQRSVAALRTSEQGRILAGVGVRLNRDDLGLPQNEESITACGQSAVLGGTNDYRGLVDPKGNFTGWYLSTNGGQSLNNEGLLPPGPGEGTGHRVRRRSGGQGGAGLLALHGRPELRSGLPPQWHRRLQERPRNARGLPGRDRGLVLAVA